MLKNWKSKNGCSIYQVLAGTANSYLINTNANFYLVDTGRKKALKTLNSNLHGIKGGNTLSALILTHTHYDHCQNAAIIKEIQGCRIIVSAEAKDWISEGYTRLPSGTMFLSNLIVRMGRKTGWDRFRYESFSADQFIDNEFTIENQQTHLRIITTPGHSSDSISIIIDNEVAIVGDAMFGFSKRTVMPPFADDKAEMVKSWYKLLQTGCSVFLPGHGKEVNRSLLERSFERYKRKY